MNNAETITWWWLQINASPSTVHFAETPTSFPTEKVHGQEKFGERLFYASFKPGIRSYGFESQKFRDRFVNEFRQFGAVAKRNPLEE